MLYTLVYVSSAVRPFSEEELTEILRISRMNNTEADITGLLLYADGNIIQILEGEQSTVEALYTHISKDTRHRSILRLFSRSAETRGFPDWSMGYKRLTTTELNEQLPGFNALLERGGEQVLNDLSGPVETLINSFRRTVQV